MIKDGHLRQYIQTSTTRSDNQEIQPVSSQDCRPAILVISGQGSKTQPSPVRLDRTRLSRNRLEDDRTESDTRYGTITNLILNRPNSDDSIEIQS